MKFRFEIRYLILLFSLSFFFSCKKDDNPSPSAPEPALFEKYREMDCRYRASGKSQQTFDNEHYYSLQKTQDIGYITSVEFFNDSSYILTFILFCFY